MKFNLFSLDIPDGAADAFKILAGVVIIAGSALGDEYAIVPDGTWEIPETVCYTPEECCYLYGLAEKDAIKVHQMKKAFGGSVVPISK